MDESLWISIAVAAEDIIFFMTEQEGYPGIVNLSTGDVNFLSNVPSDIIGHPAHEQQLFCHDNDFYFVSNGGGYVYKYSLREQKFEKLYGGDEKGTSKSCAGKWQTDKFLVVFTRTGDIISWSFNEEQLSKNTVVSAKNIIWAAGLGECAWLLDKDTFDLYQYDVITEKCNVFHKNIMNGFKTKSRSWLPVHHMRVDGKKIYIHDAEAIYEYDIQDKSIHILFKSDSENNGSRIIVTDCSIVIPPFSGKEFVVIDKKTGRFLRKESIPGGESNCVREEAGSATGELCVGEGIIYLPLTNMGDLILGIDKSSAEFSWFNISSSHKGKDEITSGLIRNQTMVTESKYVTLMDFITTIKRI